VITAALATSLLANLLRHSQADLGTRQVEPHRAQVLVDACGCHGNRMQGSSPHSGARVKRPPVDRVRQSRCSAGPGCAMLVGVDVDELQHALGGVVLEAAYLERVLRAAFSALVGSKYAAVVDGRLTAAALIEDCERITRYHTAITRPAKEEIGTALRACHEANRNRNRVIHDTWATRPGSVMVTLRGSQRSHDITVTVQTLAEVRQLAVQLADAAHELGTAMTTALGPDWARLENQLRQELGHDVGADPGR
jgi:hypothetical protein